MKLLLIVLPLFFALSLTGQEQTIIVVEENEPTEKKAEKPVFPRNQLGISAAANLSQRYHFEAGLGFSVGGNYTWLTKSGRSRFFFGVLFSQGNYQRKQYLSYNPQSDTFSINRSRIWFFDVPFNYNRIVPIGKRASVYFSIGISVGTYIMSTYRVTYYSDSADKELYSNPEQEAHPIYQLLIGINLGIGMEYKLREKLSLHIEPELRRNGSLEYAGNARFTTFGISLGLRRNF